ncbi:uncharacterized protein LOC136094511 [Hydra vulgaris]|uniref:uncharacterized protein LOC136094511 n=1 Tax=Hydra vulgaris TaxID=6087 RepID=UPI0032EA1124
MNNETLKNGLFNVNKEEIAKLFEGYKKEFEFILKQQEKVFIDIISGNLKIFNGILEKVEKDIEELKHSLNFHEELIDEKVKKANVFSKEDNSEITRIKKKLREIEDRSRCNNLLVDGINKNEGESWKESEFKLRAAFRRLKSKKSEGFDKISIDIVKSVFDIIEASLFHVFDLSFKTGIVPDKLKIARITPVFKSGDKSNILNYRPISILPCFSKLLERIMYNRLYNYLTENDMLYCK